MKCSKPNLKIVALAECSRCNLEITEICLDCERCESCHLDLPLKSELKATGKTIVNASCGLFQNGKLVFGCGLKPGKGFQEYSYLIHGYESLWSTVVLCPGCRKGISNE